MAGQAGAVRLGVARALIDIDPELRAQLLGAEAAGHDRLGDEVSVSRSQAYYVDVTHPRANKGDVARLRALAKSVITDRRPYRPHLTVARLRASRAKPKPTPTPSPSASPSSTVNPAPSTA